MRAARCRVRGRRELGHHVTRAADPVLDEFAARDSGSGETGTLDGPEFLAALLEWVSAPTRPRSTASSKSWRSSMCSDARQRSRQGHRTARLDAPPGRHAAASAAAHRSTLVALTHRAGTARQQQSGERFKSLYSRFEATLQEARDAREAVVGSFDVLIARGGHKTNRIMTVLSSRR